MSEPNPRNEIEEPDTAPGGQDTVQAMHDIFMREQNGTFDFSLPLKAVGVSSIGATISYNDGILPNKTYYFVVRARNSGLPLANQEDTNVVQKMATTTPTPPSFAGIDAAVLPNGAEGDTVSGLRQGGR